MSGGQLIYYLGRGLEIVGLWMTLESMLLAGPMGPNPKWAAAGVGVFVLGWLLVRPNK